MAHFTQDRALLSCKKELGEEPLCQDGVREKESSFCFFYLGSRSASYSLPNLVFPLLYQCPTGDFEPGDVSQCPKQMQRDKRRTVARRILWLLRHFPHKGNRSGNIVDD